MYAKTPPHLDLNLQNNEGVLKGIEFFEIYAIITMLHIFNNPKLGHTVGKNVCSRLVLGKCVATLRGAFFVRSLWAHFLLRRKRWNKKD